MKRIFLVLIYSLLYFKGYSQNFTASLSGNPISTTGWNYATGVSSVNGGTFNLTQPLGNQFGYIYYATPENLTTCAQFTVDFDFQIIAAPPTGVADGIAFWYISNPPTSFNTGQGATLGLPNNPNGLLMILDTWDNDNNGNNPLETLLGYNGTENYAEGSSAGLLCPVVSSQSFIDNGQWHHCEITYLNGAINVYFDNSTTASLTGNYPLNINGYFGFSASTGGSYSTQNLKNVTITGYATPPPPTVTATTFTYCQYVQADSLSATGTNLTWYTNGPNGTLDTLTGTPTPNTSVPGTYYYYVSQQPNVCVSSLDTFIITVNPQPAVPVITGDTSYCHNAPFVPFNVTGQGILWYTADTGGTGASAAPVVNTTAAGTYTYYAGSTVNGCNSSARDSISIVVYPLTPAPTVINPVTYCQYDVPVSLAGNAAGNNLLWYANPPSGAGSVTAPTPVTSVPNATIFYVSQTINNCQSDSVPVTVIVKQKPDLAFNFPDPQVCLNNPSVITYTGDAAAGSQYNWTLPADATLLNSPGTNSVTVSFNDPGTVQIGFNVNDNGCLSNDTTLSITVVVSPAPIFNFVPDACAGQIDAISYNDITGNSNNTYNWNFDNADIISGTGAGPYNITWNTPGTHNVSLSVTLNGCPSDTTVNPINVHPLPDVHITLLANNNICIGDSLLLEAGTVSVPAYAYQWRPYNYFPVNDAATVYGIIDTPAYISVQAISDYGCVNTDSVLVNTHPCCDISIPTAFTPNGDGRNDLFRIIDSRPQKIIDFRIFDRWGNAVFTATDNKGWDGTYNGTKEEIGTYFYTLVYICADGKEYQKKGDITLIR